MIAYVVEVLIAATATGYVKIRWGRSFPHRGVEWLALVLAVSLTAVLSQIEDNLAAEAARLLAAVALGIACAMVVMRGAERAHRETHPIQDLPTAPPPPPDFTPGAPMTMTEQQQLMLTVLDDIRLGIESERITSIAMIGIEDEETVIVRWEGWLDSDLKALGALQIATYDMTSTFDTDEKADQPVWTYCRWITTDGMKCGAPATTMHPDGRCALHEDGDPKGEKR